MGINAFNPGTQYDKKVDVYSHGILMWELFHSATPYYDTGFSTPMLPPAVAPYTHTDPRSLTLPQHSPRISHPSHTPSLTRIPLEKYQPESRMSMRSRSDEMGQGER